MPRNRIIPPTGVASDQERWPRLLDSSQRVALVWTTAADTVTATYYSTVSAANTARTATAKTNGAMGSVMINWWHSDIAHLPAGPFQHPDAREALPAWIDATANT